jgi:hypothetical protein
VSFRAKRPDRLRAKLIKRLPDTRVSEVFGLRRRRVSGDYVDIQERVCRRNIGKPKTAKSERQAALSTMVQADLKLWLEKSPNTGPDGWLFPSEALKTAMGPDNVN